MTVYTVIVQEAEPQLGELVTNHYNLQVAKAVSAGGKPPVYNVVYKTHVLAPNMSVAWTESYGLNWTSDMPASGATVTFGGNWQECELGSSYDLDPTGSWTVNNSNPNKDDKSLNIGANNYPEGVNVTVGVKDTSGTWHPIFVDSDKLLPHMHGSYMPIERVRLWWEENLRTSTMASTQGDKGKEAELTNLLTYFSYVGDAWKDPQPVPFA